MAELLKSWVNSLHVSSNVEEFERDLANGFCFGEILAHPDYDLLKTEEFSTFANNDSAEAKVSNFQHLAPVLRDLGIKFDSLIANQIMTEKHGVALRLLHQIKQSLQSLQSNAFSASTAITDYKRGDAVSQQTSVAYLSGAKSMGKTRYESIEKHRFDDKLRKMVPNSYEQKLASHLKPFQDHADHVADETFEIEQDEAERARMSQVDRRQGMLDKYHHNKQFMEEWQSQGVEQHKNNMGNRREEIKRCLRYELATKENANRKQKIKSANARHDVEDSIDSFETTLRRLGKAETEELADDAVKARLQAPPVSTLEHMKSIERSLPNFGDMGHAADNYIRSIKKKKSEEDVSRKERDRRRRKVLLDQQSAQKELEMKRKEEMLLEKLCRQSKEERKVAETLWECQLHKDILRENRKHRDRQEEAARARDKELKAEAEKGARRAAYEEYQRRVAETLERREAFEAKLADEKSARHYEFCEEVFGGVLDLVARTCLYREDTDGGWPEEELAEWTVAWCHGEQLWPPPPAPPDPVALAKKAEEEAAARDPVRVEEQPKLDEAEWNRFLKWSGPWAYCPEGETPAGERPQAELVPPPGGPQTVALCDLITTLDKTITPVEPAADTPDIPQFPVAVSIVGKPFSGKTEVAEVMAKKEVKVISPDSVVSEAVDAYRAVLIEGKEPDGSCLMRLGQQAFEQLALGKGVSDETVVALVICEIQTLGASDTPVVGWALDGFPCTAQQAELLEKALSGYTAPVKGPGVGVFSELASLAITPTEEASDGPAAPTSGIRAALNLMIEDSTAEERAHGRVVDIDEGERYHLQSDPPQIGGGAFGRLVPEENPSSADLHIGPRIATANSNQPALMNFLKCFGIVQDVDAELPFAEVQHIAEELVADLCYKWEEAKQANMKARPPMSVAFLAPQTDMEPAAEEITPEKVQELQLSELLLSQWVEVERRYKSAAKEIFAKLRGVRREAVPQYAGVRDSFVEFLKRPDDRQVVAERFHDGFNSVEEWMRSDVEVKQELHLRCDELLEQMWDVSDQRKDLANEERYVLLGSGWLPDKCATVTVYLCELMGCELMRYQAAKGILESHHTFGSTREVPEPSQVLDVALQLGEALVPPADGPPPRQPALEDGSAPAVAPSVETLCTSLKDCLEGALALVSEEGLEEHELKEPLLAEVQITRHRLRSIAMRGELLISALHQRSDKLSQQMEQWLEARYTAEISSSTGFVSQVREAIEGEELLINDITLEDTEFMIDEGTRLVPYVSESQEVAAEMEPLPDRFTLFQLTMIQEHLLNTAPSGIILCEDLVWLLRRLVSDGMSPLPLEWVSSDEDVIIRRLQQLAQAMDPRDSGAVSWRELLVVAALPSYPNLAELLEMRKAFTAADTDGDSRVTMDEYKSVKLWFENNSKLEDSRKEGLKALLYQLFAVPDPNQPDNDNIRLFDFLACLLHICPDDSHEAGVVKAFKMVAAGDAPLKKEDVARIATAGVGVLDDMQVAAMVHVFSGKSDAARVQLEPIMADPNGNAMMLSQCVYLKKHIY